MSPGGGANPFVKVGVGGAAAPLHDWRLAAGIPAGGADPVMDDSVLGS
jgi:hypothetical protein